jgi:hypothetical protein
MAQRAGSIFEIFPLEAYLRESFEKRVKNKKKIGTKKRWHIHRGGSKVFHINEKRTINTLSPSQN